MNLAEVNLGTNQVPYLNQHKQERRCRKDQSWRRLATVNKIAQKAGYNLPNYCEKRTIEELLNQHGEYAYLTGKRLGTFYLSTLDLDWLKEEFPKKLIDYLEKSVKKLVKFLKVSYDKTKKGEHIDILTPESLDNQLIYFQSSWGKKWVIGSIQSKGKYVVGEDPNKAFIQNGKWYWKVKSNEEVKATLNKFFFILSNQEKTIRKPQVIEEPKIPLLPLVSNSVIPLSKHTIQAKILSKQKIPLSDLWKFFYSDNQGHQHYFLANGHTQKNLTELRIGAVRNICLIQGRKHVFFSRLL